MARINKVLYDVDQRNDTNDAEKKTARDNIGAVDMDSVNDARDYAKDLYDELNEKKQDKLVAGRNVHISEDNVISSDDTTYTAGYGIEIEGNVINTTHHKLMATNSVTYGYCKVFDFTWNRTYGRGLCVFTATHYGGDHVTYAVSLTRSVNADYTISLPYVVSASPYMAENGFVNSLEIREDGDRIIGYLKLRNFKQSQFWLDWEGTSEAGVVSFTPQLTNSPEGKIVQTKSVSTSDVFYSQADADSKFQKKLIPGNGINLDSDGNISALVNEYTAGEAIDISSENVISNSSPVKFSSAIGNPDISPCTTNVLAQRNGNSLTYTKMAFVNQYGNSGSFVLIPHDLGEGLLYISDNYISVKPVEAPPKKPVVRSNIAFSSAGTTESTSTWTSPTITSPSGAEAMMMYSIYVQGSTMTESDTWDVKINGSNWTTGIRGNFSSFVCMVPVSGVTFTVTGPKGINAPKISYVIFQEWV